MSIEDIIDENDRLHEQVEGLIAELSTALAKIDDLQSLVRRMATELDARAANRVDPAQETREWFGTVEWRGPTAAYEANAPSINHELALQIQRMAIEAELARNPPDPIESLPKAAHHALQEATPIDASAREDDEPQGHRYSP